jgi:cellulose biosynthesis protein BcsQ
VLLVDLDYQRSLSNMLILAIEREEVESRAAPLLAEDADLAAVDKANIHLAPKLNRAWLVPANYTFAQAENRLLLQWLLLQEGGIDVRYRLARALLRPELKAQVRGDHLRYAATYDAWLDQRARCELFLYHSNSS